MVLIAVAAVWLLLGLRVTGDRLDAIRTGGTLGVGIGGAIVLWLAIRRQRSTELDLLQKYEAHQLADRVARINEAHQRQVAEDAREVAKRTQEDAIERRITELYTKAVEQLGSDKAPVRLGGLYALERLAQNNSNQRPTIVNVLCAYLRMPYASPNADQNNEVHEKSIQEGEVRLTAQRILATHLRRYDGDPIESFWSNVDLDLTGATLVDFHFTGCHISTGRFSDATFVGSAMFDDATFTGFTAFDGATFTLGAIFNGAKFFDVAMFDGATFTHTAEFTGATFSQTAGFDGATFGKQARFGGATFTKFAAFNGAKFGEPGMFDGATFHRGASPEVGNTLKGG